MKKDSFHYFDLYFDKPAIARYPSKQTGVLTYIFHGAGRLVGMVRKLEKLDEKGNVDVGQETPAVVFEPEPEPEPSAPRGGGGAAAAAAAPAPSGGGKISGGAHGGADKKTEAARLKVLGNDAFKAKNFTEAVKQYTAAIALQPEDQTYALPACLPGPLSSLSPPSPSSQSSSSSSSQSSSSSLPPSSESHRDIRSSSHHIISSILSAPTCNLRM